VHIGQASDFPLPQTRGKTIGPAEPAKRQSAGNKINLYWRTRDWRRVRSTGYISALILRQVLGIFGILGLVTMQFVDLVTQQQKIRPALEQRIRAVLDHGCYIMGPEIKELEETLAAYVGAKNAISCASGTDALILPLMAMGIGPGDAVFVPPFTFMATAEVVSLLGATPVFVDVEDSSFNLDPAQLQLAIKALRERNPKIYPIPREILDLKLNPRAVIAVDLFGIPADYDEIDAICKSEGLELIEDAAQSFGGEYRGRRACSFGRVGATSFFPAKPFGCYGDGGMIFTDDAALAEIMRSLRVHGMGATKYENVRIGLNARMDTLQAAIMLAKWPLFADEVEQRQHKARLYTGLLQRQASGCTVPSVPAHCRSAWAQYTVRFAAGRDRMQEKLHKQGIPTAIYYPVPLCRQPAYAALGYQDGMMPVSEALSKEVLSLPFSPYIADADIEKVVNAIKT
jgi:UDP-2-acetamido-2-deoxy-ribo-hexuluronate aminotransferase